MAPKRAKGSSRKNAASTGSHQRQAWDVDPRQALRVGPDLQLASLDQASTPGWTGGEERALAYTSSITPLLASLQERLFAAATEGSPRRLLVVAQGLDTAGKGGLARHVMGLVDPQGVRLTAFKAPTAEERSHDFLWRIRKAVPPAGIIGFFDRSHYEDILVPSVSGQLDDASLTARIEQIHDFERELMAAGTAVIKVALMISYDEQGLRLLERVDRPDKHWKYATSDMDTREKWFDYHAVYQRMLRATSFDDAPWYVIPADRKWYARLAVTELVLRTLAELEISWPEAHFDVEAERARVRATISAGALARYDERLASRLDRVAGRIAAVDDAARSLSADEAGNAGVASGPGTGS
ncbi:MAG: polyphosphate kinase 2 family protein [Actinomyces sp.]|uniref:PPK2 family polyphosphate kinase n=1 Tax=Actinomyces sp. TaxID=29317 RepID=UPI0026DD7C30|nr:PPK2 family polyphosphate kinase [Actinomyces sp.]MDO4243234.1 polyphosphate kinase 2 family protein [Actinomyces sp.]